MQDVLAQFVLTGDGMRAGTLPGLPRSPFAVCTAAKPATLRRTWLDTFDWRLYRSGLTLEQVSGRDGTQILLTGRDGTLQASHQVPAGQQHHRSGARRPAWPGTLDVLPPGPLRDRLAPVVGVRALLPVARAVSTVDQKRVLNADDKTVARLILDQMSVTYPAPATVAARLQLQPLRGYQAEASRIADVLAAAPGVTGDSGPSGLQAALAAAGQRPGSYSGKVEVTLAPRMPAAQALAAVLTALLGTIEANVGGTLRDTDTEFLHDLRVAVRRSRSVLRLCGDVLPGGLAGQFRPELKWLGDLTTPTRDLDVYLHGYPAMAAGLVAAAPQELEPFGEHLRRCRVAARAELTRGLRSARFSRFCRQWRDAMARAADCRSRPEAASLAAARIARAHRRVIRDGSAITQASPEEHLHELRKRCKELRYLLEIFASLYDAQTHWRVLRDLKALQGCLGEFQDMHVQHAGIRAFAAEMASQRAEPAALLAMGEIAAGLVTRQRQARAEFAARFASFASAAGQARFRSLTVPGQPS